MARVEREEKKPEKQSCGVRLTYFDGAGRAELSRLILAAAGIEYEDRRIDGQDWKELKPGLWKTGLPPQDEDWKCSSFSHKNDSTVRQTRRSARSRFSNTRGP